MLGGGGGEALTQKLILFEIEDTKWVQWSYQHRYGCQTIKEFFVSVETRSWKSCLADIISLHLITSHFIFRTFSVKRSCWIIWCQWPPRCLQSGLSTWLGPRLRSIITLRSIFTWYFMVCLSSYHMVQVHTDITLTSYSFFILWPRIELLLVHNLWIWLNYHNIKNNVCCPAIFHNCP